MGRRAKPWRRVGEFVGLGFRQRNQFGDALRWDRIVDDQHARNAADERNWRQVLDRVVAQPFVQTGRDRDEVCCHEERHAIRFGLCYCVGADIAASTHAVLDHYWLADPFRQMLPNKTRERVAGPAWTKRRDELDGFGRKRLRYDRYWRQRSTEAEQRKRGEP